jgi:hypothetical protein
MDTSITRDIARVVPEKSTYMLGYVSGANSQNSDNVDMDTDASYAKQQRSLIEASKKTIYQKTQHNEVFDIPESGFNTVQNQHPLGVNMLSNHSDKGFDYRDFPLELEKKRSEFDPYIEWLHKNGLIGKNKSRYRTNYINVNSAYRNKTTTTKTSISVRLDADPFSFNGNDIRIAVSDTSQFSLNDKVTISGIEEKELVVRTHVTDDFGVTLDYFAFELGKQYMTVSANNNMTINAGLTPDVKATYDDMKVNFSGFVGDQKTQWYFDTRNYIWTFIEIKDLFNIVIGYTLRITENVYGVTSATSGLPEAQQIRLDMLIAEFQIDLYGKVLGITPIPYNVDDIRWTTPPSLPLTVPIGVPASYYTLMADKLADIGVNPPPIPSTIYTTMEYFQKVQNAIRPIFLSLMSTPANANFGLRYDEAGKTYLDVVRIIVPEATKITSAPFIGNILLNYLNSTHRMYLTSVDVERNLGIYDVLTSTATDIPSSQKFYIELNAPYVRRKFESMNPLQSGALMITVYESRISDVTITYRHYGGIPTKLINAQYPVGFTSITGFKYVKDISLNKYITVGLDRVGLLSGSFGGETVYLGLVEDVVVGYPQPHKYVIDLEKDYSNVVMVRMISSAFPMTQKVFMDGLSGGNKNINFYWQNIDDGDVIYTATIESGNYTPNELKVAFEAAVYNVPRVSDKTVTNQKNVIILDIDEKTDKVTFSGFNEYEPGIVTTYLKQVRLSTINVLCADMMTMSSSSGPVIIVPDPEDAYYQYPSGAYYTNFPNADINCDAIRIKIHHPNNSMRLGNYITIKDSLHYGNIPAKYLNKTHMITRVSIDDYDILLYNVNVDLTLDLTVAGGEEIKIYTPNIFRIRFDYPDTLGNELGFRDVGEETSVTPYNSVITNDVLYEGEELIDVIQAISGTDSGIDINNITNYAIRNSLSLKGPSYLVIKCKEIPNVKGMGEVKEYFYKINLSGKLGEYVYDSFVDSPIFLNDPRNRLNILTIDVLMANGAYYDFNGIDHSFVLEIVTYNPIPEATSIIQ